MTFINFMTLHLYVRYFHFELLCKSRLRPNSASFASMVKIIDIYVTIFLGSSVSSPKKAPKIVKNLKQYISLHNVGKSCFT